jgi:hypothetical protein
MKILHRFLIFLLIALFLSGCTDKTVGVEGKIVDGRGKPLAGVTVIFAPTQRIGGYEHFETKTGADGSFRLTGLAPSSEYRMAPLSAEWNTKRTIKIKTLKAGETLAFSKPFKIRFQQIKDGTVMDTKTGLQWLIYPAAGMTAANIQSTVKGIATGGFADWRLPSREELAALQENPASKNKICCTWVAQPHSEVLDWTVYIEEDNELWASGKEPPENRIVVVRNTAATSTVAKPSTPAPQTQTVTP